MEIDNTAPNAEARRALLDKLGIRSEQEASRTSGTGELGQDEFLKLMTTQLQNQDPFKPMDNGEFIAQMAQFSSVTGIRKLGDTLDKIAGQLDQFRIASTTNLLGHSVLVPGNIVRADDNGEIHGTLELDRATVDTRITFFDAETGESLGTQNLGANASGMVGFAWTDLPEDYRDGTRPVRVDATINSGDGPESLQPNIYAEVTGASVRDPNGPQIETKDYGLLSTGDVLGYRL